MQQSEQSTLQRALKSTRFPSFIDAGDNRAAFFNI
jgi:hypothetical protein